MSSVAFTTNIHVTTLAKEAFVCCGFTPNCMTSAPSNVRLSAGEEEKRECANTSGAVSWLKRAGVGANADSCCPTCIGFLMADAKLRAFKTSKC